ncbi:purine-cytosine permease-like transporter [Singulisphaera rosea]
MPADARSSILPASLTSALSTPALERKSWTKTIAPTYIGMFLWVVYFDQLGRRTLAVGGLGWSVLGAAAGGLLCFLLLYLVPATWGQRTGRGLLVLGGSTFGARGTVWLTGVLVGLVQLVWIAVSTFYATDWTLQGLNSLGFLSPRSIRPWDLGSLRVQSPLFLVTSLTWVYAAALVGNYLVRVIAALMNIYPIFSALMLAVAVIVTIGGVRDFQPLSIDPSTSEPVRNGAAKAFLMMIQMIFGYFAYAGASAADWGTVTRSQKDVRVGGLVGVAFASTIVATLALLVVAGALGKFPAPSGLSGAAGVGNFSVRVALLLGVGGNLCGVILLVIGLAALAPSVFACHVLGQRLSAVWSGLSKLQWSLLGAAIAWVFVAIGLPIRLEGLFTIMGALFAPMVGALAGDFVRSRGNWSGIRCGINPAGLIAWVIGVLIGLIPLSAPLWRNPDLIERFQPASLFAFIAAFLVYLLLAARGLEPEVVAFPPPPLPAETF